MRTGFTQDKAMLSITTSLGADVLLLDSFTGTETLSQPFRFNLAMKSSNSSIDPTTIVGTTVTVTVRHATGVERFFHGVIARFTQSGMDVQFAYYTAEMVPALWLLSLSRDRVIFQNQSATDIIDAVLGRYSITVEKKLQGTYAVREYCVQYDESPLDFVSRLMEEEGIFYFFTFTASSHTLVLADSASAHVDCPQASALIFRGRNDTREWADSVLRFESSGQLVTQTFTASDYDYDTPSTALAASSTAGSGKIVTGSIYDYPGHYQVVADGTKFTGLRLQEGQADALTAVGDSLCCTLTAGGAFSLTEHANAKLNIRYALRAVTHRADNESYTNHFEAHPATTVFRPPRRTARPVVAGSQSALVVGPDGEEIWTDTLGRIKVKFYWDQSAPKDDTSSCWVRVSQTWAGNGWGSMFIPRIGQEVIVSYIDGDPNRPIITGSVYNGERATPVALPAMQTQSVIRSRPTKTGDGNTKSGNVKDSSDRIDGNEMRMEDKQGSEQFYFHAQKDMKVDIENDLDSTLYLGNETRTIKKGNRTLLVEEGNEARTITKGDRSIAVSAGNETHTVAATRKVSVDGDETHTNGANLTHSVAGNLELSVTKDMTQTITGNVTLKVDGDLSFDVAGKITFKSGAAMVIKSGDALSAESAAAFSIKSGASLKIEALSIASKASASHDMDGGGTTTIKGGIVKIN